MCTGKHKRRKHIKNTGKQRGEKQRKAKEEKRTKNRKAKEEKNTGKKRGEKHRKAKRRKTQESKEEKTHEKPRKAKEEKRTNTGKQIRKTRVSACLPALAAATFCHLASHQFTRGCRRNNTNC